VKDFCYNNASFIRFRRGQAAVEYVLALASLLVIALIFGVFSKAAERQAERSVRLVVSEYP
jgi:hypothetical protein